MPPSTRSASSDLAPTDRLVTVPQGEPPLTLGYEVVHWASKFLRHPNGPRAGQRWQFVDSQVQFLLWWYAVDEDGRWLYQHGVRRLPKGSGKSPFAALLALAELCAPVRVKDFDPDRPGGVVGQPVEMPWIQIAATAESQTANTMRMVRAFAPKGSRVVQEYHLDPGKTKYYRMPEGTLEVITSSETAVEGAEASHVVADETEHWKPSNGGPGLMATLIDNVTKSGARVLETSNAWVPGIESVAEDSHAAWVKQEEGGRKEAARILYDARIAPPDTDLSDPDSLRKGLEFAYGDCWWQDIPAIMRRIWSPKAAPDDMRRKYLNRPTAAEDAWLADHEWKVLADPEVKLERGDDIVAFFDGSKSRDATALVACRLDDGHVFTLGVWEPNPRHTATDTVNVAEVDRIVRKMFEDYTVVAFFADVREWESFALTEWPTRYEDQLKVWAAPSTRPPQAIAWDMRTHGADFARAAEACHAEIMERAFKHDGDSRTTRHVLNARRRPHKDMVSIGKESPDSPRKVDAAVCVVGARMLYRLVKNSNQYRGRRSGTVW